MGLLLVAITLLAVPQTTAGESVVYDDGTGAQICFYLPVHDKRDGKDIEYHSFRIAVVKNDRFLLFTDLSGTRSRNGRIFSGKIIIPSDLVDSAEILMFGSPPNSSKSVQKKLKVSSLKKVRRKKSWTDQKGTEKRQTAPQDELSIRKTKSKKQL